VNNVFVYCEINEDGNVVDVSLELLSKGRKLADELGVKLEGIFIGDNLSKVEEQVFPYGVDVMHIASSKKLFPYLTLPHNAIVTHIFKEEQPEIALFGATTIGRDLAPRIASTLKCGLTADCTSLEIGDHTENRTKKEYKNLLYQIRPAFGGNIIATIINPDTRPQMATVREGVMKLEPAKKMSKPITKLVDIDNILNDDHFAVSIIERHIEAKKVNLRGSQIIVAGGYGVGSRENFDLLYELADAIGGEVAATRAAVDAGFIESDRQVGQTGVTVRPKLYIAFGISGAVQHRAGMDQSATIISVNTDPKAPINAIADYTIVGEISTVVPKMIEYYKKHSK
jgi:electron transfer flavoprotein alpha subunit